MSYFFIFILSANFLYGFNLDLHDRFYESNNFEENIQIVDNDGGKITDTKMMAIYQHGKREIIAKGILAGLSIAALPFSALGMVFFVDDALQYEIYFILKSVKVYLLEREQGIAAFNKARAKKYPKYIKKLKNIFRYVKNNLDPDLKFDEFVSRINSYADMPRKFARVFYTCDDFLHHLFYQKGEYFFHRLNNSLDK